MYNNLFDILLIVSIHWYSSFNRDYFYKITEFILRHKQNVE